MDEGPEVARLYTTTEAAQALHVRATTIRSWYLRGRVQERDLVRGRGRHGVVPVFDIEDLRPLANLLRRTQEKRRSNMTGEPLADDRQPDQSTLPNGSHG